MAKHNCVRAIFPRDNVSHTPTPHTQDCIIIPKLVSNTSLVERLFGAQLPMKPSGAGRVNVRFRKRRIRFRRVVTA